MHQKLLAKLSLFLTSDQSCMRSSVVLMKYDTFTIDQFCSLLIEDCIQFVQLLTVDIRINRLVAWKQLKIYHTRCYPT